MGGWRGKEGGVSILDLFADNDNGGGYFWSGIETERLPLSESAAKGNGWRCYVSGDRKNDG